LKSNNSQQTNTRINYQIKSPQVRVIFTDGSSPVVMDTREAIRLAQEQGVDLVEVNGKSNPPVTKIIDFGKFCYDEKKKNSKNKKNQKVQELKEISFRPNIDEHDLLHKLEFAKQFLKEGHRVKLSVQFKGREMAHPQVGRDKLEWAIQQLSGLILPDFKISMEGKFMFLTILPVKNN